MNKVKELLALVAPKVLQGAKAVVAFVVGAFVAYLAKHGIEVPGETSEAIQAGLYGLIVAIWVFVVPNKQ